ncbi:flagellar basal body rod protein FlgC [Parvibaculum sp.]|uniref:flagellar basal body rod protein FlgC n=1 Tax=Parvibaculum sp. TaxID=2024848 RepID=UPI00272F23F6|nr:flagellar basal body rod protein FlgC [Parvibaculum sp.]MDP1627118.1 flagellar basal body rod protein FlgC [Parvibaculum sp.]MDP2149291.1 flagellar basal body rod protein FlgC [Parvibaculum sp.]MDP3329939.1 flagellar basal body rod protein FlgC [Parvibaculum sp.]
MDLIKSMMVAASGLKAQSGRMRVIAENIANSDSTARVAGGDPYRRKIVTFEDKLNREIGANTVTLGRPVYDKTEFQLKYMPGHPAADEAGYVKMPNVNSMVEAMDMREAQRSYEANLNLIQASRRMIAQTIDILRK